MLTPAPTPLGAPGVFTLPELLAPTLHPQRMDVAAFVGVAPRGPAREPEGETGYQQVSNSALSIRRSRAVLVRSFAEYQWHFGGFEGPGLLPHAVASYFEQGGQMAWVVRVVPTRNATFDDGCARGTLSQIFTQAITFIARNEGSWGNRLSVQLSFSTTAQAFTLAGSQIQLREPMAVGSTVRFTDSSGTQTLARVTGLHKVRDNERAREYWQLTLDTPPSNPLRMELVEARIFIHDGGGRSETFDHLALVANHPNSISNVLCNQSTLLWPAADWAAATLQPNDSKVELLRGQTEPFHAGEDRWEQLVPGDFFDSNWSAADETPGQGICALAHCSSASQLVVPDLYLPSPWAASDAFDDAPSGGASAEFSRCATPTPGITTHPIAPVALTGLVLDPRTQQGLADIISLQQQLVDFCETTQNLIALLDVPPSLSLRNIEHWRAQFNSNWAAAYHPWLIPLQRDNSRPLPPSAVAAGIIARRELARGIQYGPANEIAHDIIHLSDPRDQSDLLHPQHINCFVRQPDGIALIAARTLSRERNWRHLSVRRLILMLRRTLLAETQWAVFEPNGPALWRDLQHAIESLLRGLFRQGCFAGNAEAEAFFVRVLTEPARLDRGELIIEIGIAPVEPLEFILVRLHRDGDGTLGLEE